jgi:hypothetical protein
MSTAGNDHPLIATNQFEEPTTVGSTYIAKATKMLTDRLGGFNQFRVDFPDLLFVTHRFDGPLPATPNFAPRTPSEIIVFWVRGNAQGHIVEPANMFPSDGLVAQIRMLWAS